MLQEKDALALLRRHKAAGLDVIRYRQNFSLSKAHLLHYAAMNGQNDVIDFAIDECGCDVEAASPSVGLDLVSTPLLLAISFHQPSTAFHLLQKHNAKASYPSGVPAFCQPVTAVLNTPDSLEYSDDEAEKLLRALIEKDPFVLSYDCFQKPPGGCLTERGNSFYQCVAARKPRCLELLLTGKLAGAMELASSPFKICPEEEEAWFSVTPAQTAATYKQWDCLALLMRHADVKVSSAWKRHWTQPSISC